MTTTSPPLAGRRRRGGVARELGRLVRSVLLLIPGAALAVTGMGLTLAFGVFAFIGIPVLAVGLGLITAAIDRDELTESAGPRRR